MMVKGRKARQQRDDGGELIECLIDTYLIDEVDAETTVGDSSDNKRRGKPNELL